MQEFADTPEGIRDAADVLRRGDLLAFPTETVFGLGADACDGAAVAKIYAAKGRPSFNPLIVHLAHARDAKTYVKVSDQAQALMDEFWPGPLTLVLPLLDNSPIAAAVSAGLNTLAIRVPNAPLAQALLAEFARPVAAPSANRSGKISPTTADHVRVGLGDRIDGLLNGPACKVGLESTIVGFDPDPVILRPGSITADQIATAIGKSPKAYEENDKITAPGQLTSHYAPNSAVRLNANSVQKGEVLLGFGPMECSLNLSPSGDLDEAGENLFSALTTLDQSGAPIAVAPIPDVGVGIAINDRLRRAAAPRD